MNEQLLVVDGMPARVVFDLVGAPRAEVDAYLAGRVDGYLDGEAAGYTRGWATCNEEISALQRAAHRVTQAIARLEPHADRVAGIRRRQLEAAQQHDENARSWALEAS